jgi:hypothetical protein
MTTKGINMAETYEIEDGIVVEFDYSPEDGDGWNEPRTPERVDIYSVLVGSVQLIDYIDKKTLALWEEHILNLGDD